MCPNGDRQEMTLPQNFLMRKFMSLRLARTSNFVGWIGSGPPARHGVTASPDTAVRSRSAVYHCHRPSTSLPAFFHQPSCRTPSLLNLPDSYTQPLKWIPWCPKHDVLCIWRQMQNESPTKLYRGHEGASLNDPCLLSFSEWGI